MVDLTNEIVEYIIIMAEISQILLQSLKTLLDTITETYAITLLDIYIIR